MPKAKMCDNRGRIVPLDVKLCPNCGRNKFKEVELSPPWLEGVPDAI